MKKMFALVAVLILVLAGCSSNGPSESGRETLVVGMECAYAPYNWTQSSSTDTSVPLEGGQYCDGYDVQIARMIADALDMDLVVRKIKWEGLILSLQIGEIDAIIAGMSPTPERAEEIAFSRTYYTEDVGFGIVVSRNGDFADATGLSDFAGARITAQVGTFHVDLAQQFTGVDLAEFMLDFPSMTMALQAGELDGFIADSGTGRTINESLPGLVYIQLDGADGFVIEDYMTGVSVGLNKNSTELLERINTVLNGIPESTFIELMDNAVASAPNE